jgi:hypothetical protein
MLPVVSRTNATSTRGRDGVTALTPEGRRVSLGGASRAKPRARDIIFMTTS